MSRSLKAYRARGSFGYRQFELILGGPWASRLARQESDIERALHHGQQFGNRLPIRVPPKRPPRECNAPRPQRITIFDSYAVGVTIGFLPFSSIRRPSFA